MTSELIKAEDCADCGIAKIISEGKWSGLDQIREYVATEADKAQQYFDPDNLPQFTPYIYRIGLPPVIDYQSITTMTGKDLLDGFNNLPNIRPRLISDKDIVVKLNGITEQDKLALVLTVIEFIGEILAKYYEANIVGNCEGKIDTITEIQVERCPSGSVCPTLADKFGVKVVINLP